MEYLKRREVKESNPNISIEELKSKENLLIKNVIDSANVLYYTLASVNRFEDCSQQRVKDFLQRQRLMPVAELRVMSVEEALRQYDSDLLDFNYERSEYLKEDPARMERMKKYVNHRRAILGIGKIDGEIDQGLPTMKYYRENHYREFRGGNPEEKRFRVNIADYPSEDREELWSLVVRDLVELDSVQEAGFGSKVTGSVKTDGLIFYFGDRVIDGALSVIVKQMKGRGFGRGESARFGQLVDERISGLTVTCDPKNNDTFGDSIAGGLYAGLESVVEKVGRTKLMNMLLDNPSNQMDLWGEVSWRCEEELKKRSSASRLHPNVAFYDQV